MKTNYQWPPPGSVSNDTTRAVENLLAAITVARSKFAEASLQHDVLSIVRDLLVNIPPTVPGALPAAYLLLRWAHEVAPSAEIFTPLFMAVEAVKSELYVDMKKAVEIQASNAGEIH